MYESFSDFDQSVERQFGVIGECTETVDDQCDEADFFFLSSDAKEKNAIEDLTE